MLESLLNKVSGLRACNFTKKRLQHLCFPVNIVIFLRTLVFSCEYCEIFEEHLRADTFVHGSMLEILMSHKFQ